MCSSLYSFSKYEAPTFITFERNSYFMLSVTGASNDPIPLQFPLLHLSSIINRWSWNNIVAWNLLCVLQCYGFRHQIWGLK